MKEETRRSFLRKTALASTGVAFASPFAIGKGWIKKSPNARINVGLIGCKGVGWSNLMAALKLPEVQCTGLCDVDANVLKYRNEELEKVTGKKAPEYGDFRKMLESKDIDAVIIATPDHWHAYQMITACSAGKDVYVEKPLANSIEECSAMAKAAEHYKRVVQVGQQQRSGKHWQSAIKYLQEGHLGKIRKVHAWAFLDWKKAVPVVEDSPVPEGVDYDMWLGPAPSRPFNKNRFHFTFRWFWDYAGGLMTDWGVHMIDIVMLGMKAGQPNSVMASGGKYAYPDDAMQTPDTLMAIYEYNDFLLTWEHGIGLGRGPYDKPQGVAFVGSNGTLVGTRAGWEVIPEYEKSGDIRKYKTEAIPPQLTRHDPRKAHLKNFIDCMKSREETICPIHEAADVAKVAHLGNIAYRTGEKLHWDAQGSAFKENKTAQEYVSLTYRDPWALPKL